MKKIILFLFIFLFELSAYADPLQGNITYDIKQTAPKSSSNIPYEKFEKNYCDKDYNENYNYLLSGKTELKDRTLALFSDGTYAVQNHEDLYNVYYYDGNGVLTHIEHKESLNYPYKSKKYDVNGKIVNTTLRISKEETYIYSKDGNLLAHWLKNNAYDETET